VAGIFPTTVQRPLIPVLAAGFLLMGFLGPNPAAAEVPVITHQVEISFSLDRHAVQITDRLTVPAGIDHLRLGEGFRVEVIKSASVSAAAPGTSVSLAEDEDGSFQKVDLAALGLAETGGNLTVIYKGVFHESVEEVVFSRENVGGEITATIGEEGIYLSSSAEWLPWAENTMATFDLIIDTPAGFETVTQGQRTEHEKIDPRLRTRWVAANPSDGINLIANRYFVHEEPVRDGVVSYTFFLEDDARLRATYMERTRAYIEMYEEMIGPYPYTKFATVENWFPTGYGMPSYTLLGGQVLRLPFIPYTSFGHEIAHNWWGNSVFVDTDEGNWCEGLTVYCADYHYKEIESPEAARQYRRTLLKDYAAYVKDPAQDFPLSEFMSRHSGATRAVGYGKSMMVFHMADRAIGRENFLAGLRKVAAENHYTKASWSDFMTAFAVTGGRDLTRFQEEWLTRAGAPTVNLDSVDFHDDKVVFTLSQDEPAYFLEVSVVLTTGAGTEEHVVVLDQSTQEFTLKTDGVKKLAVDPDCHLFRRLHPQEIEPTISQVLAAPEPVFVNQATAPDMVEAARNFAAGFTETDDFLFLEDGALPTGGRTGIVINPAGDLLKELLPADLVVSGTTVFVAGTRFSLQHYDLVFAARDPGDAEVTDLVILCSSPHRLEALARRVGHYGKYSWLLLPSGQGKVLRGNWPTGASPLVVTR
jgi:aminopeptidase N